MYSGCFKQLQIWLLDAVLVSLQSSRWLLKSWFLNEITTIWEHHSHYCLSEHIVSHQPSHLTLLIYPNSPEYITTI